MNPCLRAGCEGHYAADGYCDECGHKGPAGALPAQRVPAVAEAGMSRSVASTRSTRSTRSSRRGRIGGMLVTVPPVPLRDPTSAILTNPVVPESHRVCGACGQPVGQSVNGKPGRPEGFCPRDRTPFSFTPSLKPGDVVDGRYEILGCLAHGGLGWIYLGRDRNISNAGADRWVVLKGLLNTGDADALEAAIAERRFLVEVDHPNIVKIYDFAEHPDPISGDPVGYIVMEYVGGRSLRDIALNHRSASGTRTPLPLAQVLAYGMEILPAIGYLHDRGLLFCDFKPDNVIHVEDQLKLIDLGAVRRIDDEESALYGTPGYQAPELATAGSSIASDLYTVGRTLAVLSFDFTGFTTRYASSLPDPGSVPLLAQEESYHRLLRRATHANPERRFFSAVEMADQLAGVLREVLSAADGVPRPAASTQFTGELRTFGADGSAITGRAVATMLPQPLVDPADPGATTLATLDMRDPDATVRTLTNMRVRSLEVRLRLIRAQLDARDPNAANKELGAVTRDKANQGDWRINWYTGLIALYTNDFARARDEFNKVYDALPGELAPQLALAVANELAGDRTQAIQRYERVWRVDHGFPSAAFGLARARAAGGDRTGALTVLDEVPDSSSQYEPARVAAVRVAFSGHTGALQAADLVLAGQRLQTLQLDTLRLARMSVELLETALRWVTPNAAVAAGISRPVGTLLGRPITERDLRFGLERAYRTLATHEPDTIRRHALVDRANAVRPRTMV